MAKLILFSLLFALTYKRSHHSVDAINHYNGTDTQTNEGIKREFMGCFSVKQKTESRWDQQAQWYIKPNYQ